MRYLALIFALLPTAALANANVGTAIEQQATAPVHIDECDAGLVDTQYGNTNYYLEEAIGFTNTSEKTADLVEFRFDIYDGFGSRLSERYGQKSGTFSPNIAIQVRRAALTGSALIDFTDINIWPSMAAIKCSVSRVRFTDGTVWQAS